MIKRLNDVLKQSFVIFRQDDRRQSKAAFTEGMSRFDGVSDDDILDLLEKMDSHDTKKVIKSSFKILKQYCNEKGEHIGDVQSSVELTSLLRRVYFAARTQKGDLYTK